MQIVQPPHPGDLVRVRRRRWRIRDVRTHDDCHVVTLVSVGAADFGTERRVIAPFDRIEPFAVPRRVRRVSSRAWRRACRTLLARNAPPGALRAAGRPRIDLLPHQLEPALAVVRGLGTRVLLADAVGLGKTIEAALILLELKELGAADRVLILAPAGLRDQWTGELRSRFNTHAAIVDSRELRRRRAELPIGVNPWQTVDMAVTSIDFVKRPEILSSVGAARWDVVIVDEAHNVAGDSARHAAVAALAARAAYVVLLTATPHNGDARAFSALCNLGAHHDPLLVFRRSRGDVGLAIGRRVHLLHVRPSAAERRMHALVEKFGRAVADAADGGQCDAAWLALAVLNKRALSSARSLQHTVDRRLAALAPGATDIPWQFELPLADPDGETDAADEAPDLPAFSFRNPAQERLLLQELADAARAAAAGETKIAALARLLRRAAEPAVVFTEYRDTLQHIAPRLGRPAAILHGGLTRDERRAALDDFTSGRRSILLATDAAGEGLNLHQTCRFVINLELPWNPMRLEQRIGRVDRIGQQRKVHAVHLIARGTSESRILDRLRARIARAQTAVGVADPIGGDDERSIARLVAGRPQDAGELEQTAPPTLPTTSLKTEACEEARRLEEMRRLIMSRGHEAKPTLEPDGVWLSAVRHRGTRIALGRRMLILARGTCEDGCGRLLESALVAMVMAWPHCRADRVAAYDLLAFIEPEAVRRAEFALVQWRERATALAERFFAARLERARTIASAKHETPYLFQPGLFDRRAERQRGASLTQASHDDEQAGRNIVALERASRISIPSPRLVLILLP